MSIKIARKIGFFSALTMLVGSVVGIGIFFKNGSVLGAAGHSGTTAITGWIIGGLLATFAAISFSEIGSTKIKDVTGLPAWSEDVGGKKYGYLVRINFTIFYYGLLTPLLGFFVSELFFQFLVVASEGSIKMQSVGVNAIVGVLFSITALLTNIYSIKASGWVQSATTVIKFVPLLLALILGIVLPTTHNAGGVDHFDVGALVKPGDPSKHIEPEYVGSYTFTGLLAGIPAILFAYDAFLGVGQLTNKTKGGSKTTSKVVLVGLISITVLYTLLSLSAMLHGGFIGQIISDTLPSSAALGVNIFVFLILFISGYGVLNGISAAAVASFEQLVDSKTLYGNEYLTKKVGERNTSIIYVAIFVALGWIITVLPAVIIDSDQYVDATSNFIVLFFFAIYAITIALYALKRNKMNSDKMNSKLFYTAAIAFVVGTAFVVAYQLFYGFTAKVFIDGTSKAHPGIGLFAPKSHIITNIEFFGIFIAFLGIFALIPAVNYALVKYVEKRDPFVKTQ